MRFADQIFDRIDDLLGNDSTLFQGAGRQSSNGLLDLGLGLFGFRLEVALQ